MNKKFVRRFAAAALALCLFLGILPLHAEQTHDAATLSPDGSETETLSEYTVTDELREYLMRQLYAFNERIDISRFSIPFSEIEKLHNYIWRELPECFHVYKLGYYSGDPVPALHVEYSMEPDEYYQKLQECKTAAETLISGIEGNDSLSDVEKALLIHDRLALHNEYDYTFANDSNTIYAALVKRNSVCDGYSKAYSYLLRLVGMECISCISIELDHSWNLVKIDGEYYHVDVTWDDPSWARGSRGVVGQVYHQNFLLSNEGIRNTPKKHEASDYYAPATSTKYDGYFWQNVNSAFLLTDGEFYYIDGSSHELMRLNEDKVSGTPLYLVFDKWSAGNSSYYKGNFSRLANSGNLLFFNTSDTVYSFDLVSGEAAAVFKPELADYESIYGLEYDDGYLVCDINDCPTGDVKKLRQVRELYVFSDISADLYSTLEISDTHTLLAVITSTTGISGYYFGTKDTITEDDIIATDEDEFDLVVSEPGTYYFVAFDGNGKPSEPVIAAFCLVTLHPNGGTVEYENLLIIKDFPIDLPSPEREGFEFLGWSQDPDATVGTVGLEIADPPERSEYYAVWRKIVTRRTANGKVVSKAPVIVITADIDSNILDMTTADENGEFEIEITDDTIFVAIYSQGYFPLVYLAEEYDDTVIDAALLLVGDANEDGNLNNKDVTALFKYVSGSDVRVNEISADVNGDNSINNKDVTLLFRFLSGSVEALEVRAIMMF